MGKLNDSNNLSGQRTSRSLLAITLAASLAAFGCTSNQNLGNGTPTRSGPEVRTAPTSGVTSGSETTTPPSNPPMTSSYTKSEVLPAVTMRSSGVIRRSPDEAAAIMAGHQPLRGRYLGVVSPGSVGRPYESSRVQTYVNPALQTNPQLTVNSSISSQPNPVISSGAEGIFDAGGIAGGVITTGGTTAAATVAGVGGGVAGDPTPTTAAVGLPIGVFAGTSTLPTIASSGVPAVTAASAGLASRAVTTAGTATTVGTTTTAASTATGTATTTGTTTTTTSGARLGSASGAIRVLRGTNGSVTVTNVGTTTTNATTTSSGRNQ